MWLTCPLSSISTQYVAVSELSENTPGVDYALSLLTNVGLAPGASDLLSEASLAESLTVWIMAQSNGGVCCYNSISLWNNMEQLPFAPGLQLMANPSLGHR